MKNDRDRVNPSAQITASVVGRLYSVLTAVVLLILFLAVASRTPALASDGDDHDPWMGFNRTMFTFNDKLDMWILEPAARGWDYVMPKRVQQSVSNFFENLRTPRIALNNLLQGKPRDGASDVGRFLVNTTVGLVGFFDPASSWGMPSHDEDFGQTLGVWGVPAGPYLVLPFLGPSDPRDTGGLVVDYVSSVYWFYAPYTVTIPLNAVNTVNGRARILDTVHDLKEASVDYYVAVRNGFLQRRQAQVEDRTGLSEKQGEELYKLEDDKE
ncbi:MAG TPA: VacJ family lipoprotein [Candidatus Acidoferrales bacterium]|nr:VacJ family lipoprotein [Candidatus Acidoferrales bacterium]